MKAGVMIFKSIRWRLQVWLAFLLVCVLTGFGVTVYQLQRVNQLKQIDEELERRVAALDRAVRGGPPPDFARGRPPFDGRPGEPGFDDEATRPPPLHGGRGFLPPGGGPEMRLRPRDVRLSPEVSGLFEDTRTNGFYFAIWSRDRTLLRSSTNAPVDVPLPVRLPGATLTHTRMRDALRESYHYTELGDCVLAGRNITDDLSALGRFAFWLLAAGGTVLAFGLGGGWWLTTRAIRPVEEMSAAASRISAGNLSERIVGANADNELGRLAGVLNSTFARLEAAFAQQQQFTADASHELRTPLAVIISEAQTALARDRSSGEYRETVEACLDSAQQMRRLTESLLELARLDASEEPIQREDLDLLENTRACVERIRTLAEERGIKIHCDLKPARVYGDADRLGQVTTNLLTNAIHYNKPNGDIRVSTLSENGAAIVRIADSGQGIAAEDLPHIFERFYRADTSRSRAAGRSGLGLAISKAIVNAHGGTIEVSTQPGSGTTFTVRLRADPPA
jgi:heavy metal sensor kinase